MGSTHVITLLKQIFSEQGIPQIVRSDNGPQFASHAFTEFCRSYSFNHITSSPHYPRSNGFIESQVKTVKATLQKVKKDQGDPYLAVLCLCTTPVDYKLPSPAEMLQNRVFHDNLPKISKPGDQKVLDRLGDKQEAQKQQYDGNSKPLKPLTPGLPVRVQHPTTGSWEPGTVQGVNDTPRSYALVTKSGSMITRNRQQIRPPEHPSPVLDTPDQSALNDSNPADSLRTEVKDCHVNTPSCGLPASSQLEYVTRSGRLVKPVSRPDM